MIGNDVSRGISVGIWTGRASHNDGIRRHRFLELLVLYRISIMKLHKTIFDHCPLSSPSIQVSTKLSLYDSHQSVLFSVQLFLYLHIFLSIPSHFPHNSHRKLSFVFSSYPPV